MEALAKRLRRGARRRGRRCVPVARPAEIPLSFAQRRLWFLDRLEGPSATYTIPMAVRLTGALDRRGAGGGARRPGGAAREPAHGVPRRRSGVPRQLILDAAAARPRLAVAAGAARRSLPRRSPAAARRGFDLASEPPLRAHLFALGDARARAAAAAAPHCGRRLVAGAAGARSRARLCGALRGQAPELPALPVQYADYTLWQHAGAGRGERSATARLRASWRSGPRRSQELPDQLDLPSDRPRPAVASYRGDSVPLQLSARAARAACWRWRARAGRACSWCCRRRLRRC